MTMMSIGEILQEIDTLLDKQSGLYKQITDHTQFINQSSNVHHRHLFDIMKKIKNLIPLPIFQQYAQEYLQVIQDCVFRPPERLPRSWKDFQSVLINIHKDHQNDPFIPDVIKAFNGGRT